MKNVQLIDAALNCTYDLFEVEEEDFVQLFPDDRQDIEFSEDFFQRLGDAAQPVWDRLWQRRLDKKSINGIHGTLFCGLVSKKAFYPTKREAEMVSGIEG